MHDVIGLALRTTTVEMHEEDFKEWSVPVCMVGTSTAFQILSTKFL